MHTTYVSFHPTKYAIRSSVLVEWDDYDLFDLCIYLQTMIQTHTCLYTVHHINTLSHMYVYTSLRNIEKSTQFQFQYQCEMLRCAAIFGSFEIMKLLFVCDIWCCYTYFVISERARESENNVFLYKFYQFQKQYSKCCYLEHTHIHTRRSLYTYVECSMYTHIYLHKTRKIGL